LGHALLDLESCLQGWARITGSTKTDGAPYKAMKPSVVNLFTMPPRFVIAGTQ